MLTKLDRAIIRLLAQDIPLTDKPFAVLAQRLGIEEKDLLSRIRSYKKRGLMRKFSAALNHRKVGFRYNAMVVWNIPSKFIEKAGNIMASFPEVTHCYQRIKISDWNYSLYSMIHGKTKKECLEIVRRISKKIDFRNYKVLFSSKEYKKSAVSY
jgi:DNA-binding Lrp family transcriptional regulator